MQDRLFPRVSLTKQSRLPKTTKGIQNISDTFCKPIVKKQLLLAILVALIEFVNTSGCINKLDFTGVERMGCIGNLHLYHWILNSVNIKSLFCRCTRAGNEYCVV